MKQSIAKWASPIQNGFVTGRALTRNIPTLDSAARIYGLRAPQLLPNISLYDFKAAFPSVSWKWLFLLLDRSGLPIGLRNILRAMYTSVHAFSAEDSSQKLFEILSGILQGCPLSGSLFVLAMNPFLYMLQQALPDPKDATIVACADDVGIALQNLVNSKCIQFQFARFEKVSALCLKPAKCVLVPCAQTVADFEARARSLLATVCPPWLGFAVRGSSKFLGFVLGPEATEETQWKDALDTFMSRTDSISQSLAPAAINTELYRQRAIPVLGYLPMPSCPPPGISKLEARAVHKILRFPYNSVTLCTAAHSLSMGLPQMPSVCCMCVAAGVRFALQFESDWRRMLAQVAEAASIITHIDAPAGGFVEARLSPKVWRTKPVV